jgi:hypothetical protein
LCDVAEGSQLLNRFRELFGSRLDFVEQPDVLDSDYRLISERLHKFDLLRRKLPRLKAPQYEDTNQIPRPQQRYAKGRSKAHHGLRIGTRPFWILQHVWYVNGLPLKRGPPENRTTRWRTGEAFNGARHSGL